MFKHSADDLSGAPGLLKRGLMLVTACIPIMGGLVLAAPATAIPGDLDWGSGDSADYDHWTPAQYNSCANDQSIWNLNASTLGIESGTEAGAGITMAGIVPARCYSQFSTITNDLSYPINVRYVSSGDDGTIANYLFEWITGWNEQVVAPNASTTQFTLSVGLPWDSPNASRKTSGSFWWQFAFDNPVPTATDDTSQSNDGVPVTVDVLANDKLELAGDLLDVPSYVKVTAVTGDPAEGAWAVNRAANAGEVDTVTFTPAPGFSGTAHASYTITGPDGSTSSAEVIVTVSAAVLSPELALEKTVDTSTITSAGETLVYSFKLTNTGDVPLSGLRVVETEFTGSGTLSEVTCPAPEVELAPSSSVTCTANYKTTGADVTRGSISNTATASGMSLGSQSVSSTASTALVNVVPVQHPVTLPTVDSQPAAPPATLPTTGSKSSWMLSASVFIAIVMGSAVLAAARVRRS